MRAPPAFARACAATTCQVQQNAPLESGFAYNFYYGSTHGHSNYSDGGHPLTGCSSGNGYGSGTFDPAAVYNYARKRRGSTTGWSTSTTT